MARDDTSPGNISNIDNTISIFIRNLRETESVKGNGQVQLLVTLAIFQLYDLCPLKHTSNGFLLEEETAMHPDF